MANFRTLLNFSKCKPLGDLLVSFLEIVISKGCLGGISQNSIFRNWFEILDTVLHRLFKQLISSSVTSTKRFAAINKKKPLGALITSSATNQRREFSIINYAILLIIDKGYTRKIWQKKAIFVWNQKWHTLMLWISREATIFGISSGKWRPPLPPISMMKKWPASTYTRTYH